MQLIIPISFENNIQEIDDKPLGVNFSFLKNGDASIPLSDTIPISNNNSINKKKSSRTKNIAGSEVVLADSIENELPIYQTNEPYMKTYTDTTNMLNGSINQIDIISSEIKGDVDQVRSSKTLKKKYDYLAMMNATIGTLIGTKINAIKEINGTITKCHELEMKRIKELKIDTQNVDDDQKIMDMYNAFISAPVGSNGNNFSSLGPSGLDMTLSGIPGIIRGSVGGGGDAGYQQYLSSMTPTQNMMRFEGNPNIKQVVFYDQSTGRRWFDVIDVTTMESIPNVSKKDAMFLEDTTIDIKNKVARNINLDETYPLIIVGNNTGLADY
jgi:hypothetical protein